MKIESQRFISLSNLFDGLDQLLEAWRDSNHEDFTFGDCQMSLVTKGAFLDDLDDQEEDDEDALELDEEEMMEKELHDEQLDILLKRLNDLPEDVYIDLEN